MFPKSSHKTALVLLPPWLIAGTESSGLLELHAWAGPKVPSNRPSLLNAGFTVVILFKALLPPAALHPVPSLVTVTALSSQNICLLPAVGAIPLILKPLIFNSASIIGTLVRPIYDTTVTVVAFVVTGLPKPSLPSHGINFWPGVFS